MEEKDKKNVEIDPITNDEFVADHEFDGIRELANDPPFWLTFLFIITVLFAYAYWVKYHYFKAGPLQEEKYEMEIARFEAASAAPEKEVVAAASNMSAEEIAALEAERDLEAGAKIYKNFCATCHLEQGQGMTGPNLTDEYWIHGGSFEDVVSTIANGVIEKGMIPWKNQLSAQKINQVAKFIKSLEGTNPPNPKAPEGEKYVE